MINITSLTLSRYYNIYGVHLYKVNFRKTNEILISPERFVNIRANSAESLPQRAELLFATNRLHTQSAYYCEAYHGRMRVTKR